ncbi:MAG: hypothetical protein IT306_22645 [Chloroflexi bacterium]|nr:hypothetical protein [Chloroflexota bacterium]
MWNADDDDAGDAAASAWLLLLRDGTPAQRQHARVALAGIFERRDMLAESIALLEANIQAGAVNADHLRWLARLYRDHGDVLGALQAAAAANSLLLADGLVPASPRLPEEPASASAPAARPAPDRALAQAPARALSRAVTSAPAHAVTSAPARRPRRWPRISALTLAGVGLGLLAIGITVLAQQRVPRALSAMPPVSLAVPTPSPAAPEAEQTLLGESSVLTRRFSLAGGVYALDWIAYRGQHGGGAFVVLLTDAESGVRVGELVRTVVPPDERFLEQVTPAQRIPPGRYVLEVEAPGNWVVTVSPRPH